MSVADLQRVVLDTNTLVRGFASRTSPSGEILTLCEERRMLLLLSRPVIVEYRRVLASQDILRRNPSITPTDVERVIRRLRYLGEYLSRIEVEFRFDRDPDDQPFLELAIQGRATHLITNDNDLLSLPAGHDDAAKRFRQRLHALQIVRPAQFIRAIRTNS